MKNFDLKEFKTGRVAVHCDTELKAKDFLKQVYKYGFKWNGGESLLEDSLYDIHEKDTCYSVMQGILKRLVLTKTSYYEENGYEIVEWKIDETEGFSEEDLKVGMLVKTSQYDNFGYGMIVPSEYREKGIIYERGGWDCVFFDNITEVWGYCKNTYQALRFDTNYRKLLYKRNKVKKMTIKEVCDELGYKVEIVEG